MLTEIQETPDDTMLDLFGYCIYQTNNEAQSDNRPYDHQFDMYVDEFNDWDENTETLS